jgi:hypothetical protein
LAIFFGLKLRKAYGFFLFYKAEVMDYCNNSIKYHHQAERKYERLREREFKEACNGHTQMKRNLAQYRF